VAALNAVHAHDWRSFLRQRLDLVTPQAPLPGLERAGWQLGDADKRSPLELAGLDAANPVLNLGRSLGASIGRTGRLGQVNWNGPAFKAGLTVADELVAVAQEAYTADRLEAALVANKAGGQPLELLFKRGDRYRTLTLDIRGGPRHPVLVRRADAKDWLAEILRTR
jgi:predicted metalloprotease with PDZ domain